MNSNSVPLSHFICKTYHQLSTDEIYQILRLRAAVFVLEQNCAYQDIDDADRDALHLFQKSDNDEIIAYARILVPQQCKQTHCSIGRVVVKQSKRHLKHGHSLMQKAIDICLEKFPEQVLKISAQTYLTSFYQKLGFKNTGHFYLEDDIAHQGMIYQP